MHSNKQGNFRLNEYYDNSSQHVPNSQNSTSNCTPFEAKYFLLVVYPFGILYIQAHRPLENYFIPRDRYFVT